MTYTFAGADIRGYYAKLGVRLPDWARAEASVPCFIDPDAHQRQDRDPSMSVNLKHGAYHCNGCGAKGGAYDAATALGLDPRAAIELMIDYGLTDRRPREPARRARPRPATAHAASIHPRPVFTRPQRLNVSETHVQRWHLQLLARVDVLERLAFTRGWCGLTVRRLQLGLDHGCVTIPIRDQRRELTSLLRYTPDHAPGEPKLRAATGSCRALFPHPDTEASQELLLVEGEPDAIAARSRGLPAIAIPGVNGWRPAWAPLFSCKTVTIAFDADAQGRACARTVAQDLAIHAADLLVIDLAPARADGYDLTDWLMSHRGEGHRIHQQLRALTQLAAA
jgi:hypothetical protein